MRNRAFRGCSRGAEFAGSWPYSWSLTNNSRANLVALCRSSSVYLPGGPGAETEAEAGARVGAGAWAGAGVGVRETAGVLFRSMGAPTRSSLPPRGGLRWVHRPAIWLVGWGLQLSVRLLFFRTGWLTRWVWSF